MKTSELLEKKKVTYQDYAAWPEDGRRYEIIEGEVSVTPAPKVSHQRVVLRLSRLLEDLLKGKGEVFLSPCDVVLDEYSVVQPDILFVRQENQKIVTEDNIRGAPDLVVEVISPGTSHRDLLTKRELYEKFGVKEYWIVDLQEKTLDILGLVDGRFARLAAYRNQDQAKSPCFPEVQFGLSKVWPG